MSTGNLTERVIVQERLKVHERESQSVRCVGGGLQAVGRDRRRCQGPDHTGLVSFSMNLAFTSEVGTTGGSVNK